MRFFGTRSALVAGAMSLAVAAGAVGIFATERTGAAHAQSDENEYVGIIEALPPVGAVGTWQVSGRTIYVSDTTDIDTNGQILAAGQRVEIEGAEQPDGSIVAREIDVDDGLTDDNDNGVSDDDDGVTDDDGLSDDNGVPDDDDGVSDDDGDAPGDQDDDDDDGAPSVPGLPGNASAGGDDDD